MSKRKHPDRKLTLRKFLQSVYLRHHMWLKKYTIEQYEVTLRLFDVWHGKPVAIEDLSADLVLDFLRSRMDKSAQTVNNNRAVILAMWRFAYRKGFCKTPVPDSQDIPKIPQIKQLPIAWSLQELSRLLDACNLTRPLPGWDSRHWRALLLVAYDTSHRLSALLSAKRDDLSALGFLTIRGEHTKQGRDIVHKLHSDTLTALDGLPEHPLLFPWPIHRRAIWREYTRILKAADLPHGRRDKFHRMRKTSATHLAAVAGVEAAEQHLDHSTHGLAIRSYIDPRFMPTVQAVDVLPRPGEVDAPMQHNPMGVNGQFYNSIFLNKLPKQSIGPPTKPELDEWKFLEQAENKTRSDFSFRGEWYSIGKTQGRFLRALALADGPIDVHTLADVFYLDRKPLPDFNDVKRRIRFVLAKLRQTLRNRFDLPNGWNPVPLVGRGNGGKWTLLLPANINTGRAAK